MAGARKRITRQGLGIPESAAGQGEKAGLQSSLSTDRSSTLVGDLANVEYNTTRRIHNPSHDCDSNRDVFCYICCKYEVSSLRKQIDDDIKGTYKEIFGLHIGEHSWVPNIICNSCRIMLNRWKKDKKAIKFSSPSEWNEPLCKEDCFFCLNKVSNNFNVKNKHNIVYKTVTSVTVTSVKAPILSNRQKKN